MTNDRLKIVHEDDTNDLEHEVAMALTRLNPRDAKQEDLARLSAEAVQSTYTAMVEMAQKLREPVVKRITDMEASLKGLDDTLKSIDGFMKKVEDAGHFHAAQIDEANALSAEVQKMMADYIAKVK
jgi:hypothetical protein